MGQASNLILALMMVVTGSINTIVTKYADLLCGEGLPYSNDCSNVQKCIASNVNLSTFYLSADAQYCAQSPYIANQGNVSDDPALQAELLKYRLFDHPFVQAFTMFFGEFMCLVVYHTMQCCSSKKKKNNYQDVEKPLLDDGKPTQSENWPFYVWALPASCDACATTSMYVGLTLTHASDFQMLRGSVVIFTGLLSKYWLKRKLVSYHWGGMFLVLLGLVLVGVTGFLEPSGGSTASNPILGDGIIIAAQIIVAVQMVVEEKILTKYKVPVLCAVGWEGFFGMFYMIILSLLFTYFGGTSLPPWNAYDAFVQIYNNYAIGLVLMGTVCSIAFFNFSGLSVTKAMSATTRMVLDSIRTVVIWLFCVFATTPYNSKEHLQALTQYTPIEVVGFIVLLSGTFLYNDREVPGVLDNLGNPVKETLMAPILRKLGCMKRADYARTSGALHHMADDKGSVNRN